MTFTARLRVVQRPKPIRHALNLVELHLIGLMRLIIDDAVTLVVEACRRFRGLWAYWTLVWVLALCRIKGPSWHCEHQCEQQQDCSESHASPPRSSISILAPTPPTSDLPDS